MKKSALLERLVRLAATDVPGTPRLLMKHRSPEELVALQHGVEGAFKKIEEPAKQRMHSLIDKVPHPKVQKVLKGGADMMIENPEMIPMQAVPIPGVSLGYLAAKKGLERGLDKLAPLPKLAFTTSSYSGALNPVIETGASFQPGFKMPSLKAPVQQKVAFKLQGEMSFQGLDIAVENKPGSVRKGVDKDGKPWRTVMKWPYGYIRGTKGADGEEVDCYVGVVKDAPKAFVVHQKKDDGSYDEDKVMLGFESAQAARKGYLEHYNTDKFLGPIKAVAMDRFKKLVESGKKLTKISASSPTRGGFLLASDIPQFKAPSLAAPVEKKAEFARAEDLRAIGRKAMKEKDGDFLPDYVTYGEGDFKKSKYAAALDRERLRTQLLLEERFRDYGSPDGDISKEDAVPAVKQANSLAVRTLTGAVLGALSGAGYHGIKELTGRVPEAGAWAQSTNMSSGATSPSAGAPVQDFFKWHREQGHPKGPLRRGRFVMMELQGTHGDPSKLPAGSLLDERAQRGVVWGDASKTDLLALADDVIRREGDWAPGAREHLISMVEEAQKPWWKRKTADVSPTRPLGDGGGNPHRMQSWLASPQINSLRAPLNKTAEDGGGDYGGPAGFYYGSWQSGGGRGPVNEAGFRQASDQNGPPINSLKTPLRKLAGFLATGPSAAKNIGTKPFMQTSVADVAKPKGQKFGGPLPGANSTTLGGYNPPSLK